MSEELLLELWLPVELLEALELALWLVLSVKLPEVVVLEESLLLLVAEAVGELVTETVFEVEEVLV